MPYMHREYSIRKVGGIRFVRMGTWVLSFCNSRKAPCINGYVREGAPMSVLRGLAAQRRLRRLVDRRI